MMIKNGVRQSGAFGACCDSEKNGGEKGVPVDSKQITTYYTIVHKLYRIAEKP